MHTEEFVLIPTQMYTREQPHVSQLLSNKDINNPAKQISLHQKNKLPTAPPVPQQDTEQQTDASVDDRSTITSLWKNHLRQTTHQHYFWNMSRTKKLLQNLREKKQKLLTTTREDLKRQKKKSNQPVPGRITSYQVKQLDKLYTKGSAAFGSIANLKKTSGFTRGKIFCYLQSKAPYRKYRQFRKNFPRLKAVAYRINEIWSIDVAYMDKAAQHNNGVKCLLVAVDVL